MKWQQFENKLKSALRGHQSTVDADAIWVAIEPQVDALNRRKKRRGFVWFWLVGLALAVGTWDYYYQYENSGDIENVPQELTAEKVATNASQPENTGNNTIKSSPSDEINHSDNAQNISQSIAQNNTTNSPRAENIIPDITRLKSDEKTPNRLEIKPLHLAEASSINNNDLFVEMQENISAMPTTLPFLPIDLKYTIENKEPEFPTYISATEAPLPIYRKKYFFSAGIQGSISFVDRQLEANGPSYMELLSLRERNEREMEAIQLGLRLTLRHRSGIGLTSGLNFTQINEQYRYYSTIVRVDTVPGVKYLVINLNNDTIPIYGDVPLETKTSVKKEYYNNYRLFEIPVLAGYHLRHRNFSLSAQAGVFVNVALSAKGRVLESASEDIAIEDAGIYKSNIGLNYYFGISAGYFINDNIEAYISPFMRYMPENIAKESYGLKQSYNLYGVNIGAAWHF